MKKLILTTIAVLALGIGVNAQTNYPPAQTPATGLQGFWDEITQGQSNCVAEVDGIYAPKAAEQFGVEGAVLWKATPNLLLGPGVEWVNGHAYFVNMQATLQASFKPLARFWPKLTLTPFLYTKTGTPIGNGKSVTVAGEGGGGAEVTLWKNTKGNLRIGLLAAAGKRTDINGAIYHGGPVLAFDF